MKKLLFLVLLCSPGLSFADRLGSLRSNADVLLTTQAAAGGSPGGSTGNVQYKNGAAFAGDNGFQYDSSVSSVTVAGRLKITDNSNPIYFGNGSSDPYITLDDENSSPGGGLIFQSFGVSNALFFRSSGDFRLSVSTGSNLTPSPRIVMPINNQTTQITNISGAPIVQFDPVGNSSFTIPVVLTTLLSATSLATDSTGKIIAGSGGGGTSTLAVGTGTASNFTNNITSPTAAVSFEGSQFKSAALGTTNYVSLNLASVTVQGTLLAGANVTLTPGAGTLTIAATSSGGGSSIYPATSTAILSQGAKISTLTITGAVFFNVQSANASYVATSTDNVILASSTFVAITTITLPTAAIKGQEIQITKVDLSTTPVVIVPLSGQTILGLSTVTLASYGVSQQLVADGNLTWIVPNKLVHGPSVLGDHGDATTSAAGVANAAYFQAVQVDEACDIYGVQFVVGTQSGNMDIGIYNSNFQLLSSTGSTPVPAAGRNSINFPKTVNLQPGIYYLGMSVDNITATFTRSGVNTMAGAYSMSTAFPLPATVTLSSVFSVRAFALQGLLYGGLK